MCCATNYRGLTLSPEQQIMALKAKSAAKGHSLSVRTKKRVSAGSPTHKYTHKATSRTETGVLLYTSVNSSFTLCLHLSLFHSAFSSLSRTLFLFSPSVSLKNCIKIIQITTCSSQVQTDGVRRRRREQRGIKFTGTSCCSVCYVISLDVILSGMHRTCTRVTLSVSLQFSNLHSLLFGFESVEQISNDFCSAECVTGKKKLHFLLEWTSFWFCLKTQTNVALPPISARCDLIVTKGLNINLHGHNERQCFQLRASLGLWVCLNQGTSLKYSKHLQY